MSYRSQVALDDRLVDLVTISAPKRRRGSGAGGWCHQSGKIKLVPRQSLTSYQAQNKTLGYAEVRCEMPFYGKTTCQPAMYFVNLSHRG